MRVAALRLPTPRLIALLPPATLLAAAGLFVSVLGAAPADAAQAPVGLGTATSFAVLAGSTVTNTGPSTISGDLGVSPGTAVTGFPPGTVNNGTIHAADSVAAQAQRDVTTAYNDAAGRSRSATITADLGGQMLVPGVYAGGALGLTGTVTLNAQGNPNAVFVFQAASTLITATSSSVALIGGADACHVFWQVGSSATLGTNSVFVGSVLAQTAVTADTGATVVGRLLARTAAVTLDTNTISKPACAAVITPTATPVPTSSASRTPTATPSATRTVGPTGTPTSTPPASTPAGGASPGGGASGSGGGATGPAGVGVGGGSGGLGGTGGLAGSGGGSIATDTALTNGRLPFTGAPISTMVIAGLLAIGGGGVLLLAMRRTGGSVHRPRASAGRHRR